VPTNIIQPGTGLQGPAGSAGAAGPAGADGTAGPTGQAGGAVTSATETELATVNPTTVATTTPAAAGTFLVGCRVRVVTAATVVTAHITYTDATGAQTSTWLNLDPLGIGSYDLAPVVIASAAGQAISVVVTAGTANQVYASAAIWGTASSPLEIVTSSIVGGQQLVPVGPGGSGLKIVSGGFGVLFDGFTAQLVTPYNVQVTAGSVMFWANPLTDSTANPSVIWTANNGAYDAALLPGGPISPQTQQATVSGSISDTVNFNTLTASWHLWVITFTAATLNLYRDGALVASQSGLSGAPTGAGAQMTFGFGVNGVGGGTGGIQAALAHCAFWDTTVLTPTEVAAIYANASSMTESAYESYIVGLAPTLYYPMQENTGTVATNKGTTGATNNANYGGNYILGMPGPIGGQPTLQTSPPAPTGGIVITSGTAYQNTAPYDVFLRIPVTYNPLSGAAATLDVGVGPTATPAQAVEDSQPAASTAGVIRTKDLYLPAGWYALVTATNATLGLASSQPV